MRSNRSRSINSLRDHFMSSDKASSDDVSEEMHHSKPSKSSAGHISGSMSAAALKTMNQDRYDNAQLDATSKHFQIFSEDEFAKLLAERVNKSGQNPDSAADDVDNVDKFFESMFLAISETKSRFSVASELSGKELPPVTETRSCTFFTLERELINSEKDLEDFQYYYLGFEKPKKRRGMDSSRIAPFSDKFREWELAGKSYRVIPNPQRLKSFSTSMDFFQIRNTRRS